MIETDVAIVGCGPVGALMANLLGARGIRTIVIERSPEIYQLPRAIGMDDEIMRVFQAAELEAVNSEKVYTLKGMDLLRGNRSILRRISLEGEPRTLGHPVFTLFHQPTLEANIREGLKRYPDTVELRLGEEVQEIRDLGERLEMDFASTDTGRKETVSARFVLGCDGGRSAVRRVFGVEHEDLGLHQPWVVVDAIMKRPIEVSGFAEQICDPARPGTFIPAPDPRKRWEFMIMPGDDPDEMIKPEKLRELIRPWAPPEDYDLERAVIYVFHALIARQWRMGRCGNALLMGDAAHQMPPFLGQGMCAGIRDTFNLAWKLDLVLRGGASADLLDSYQSERARHVHRVIELAVRIGKIIQSPSRVRSYLANAAMVLAERLHIDMPMKTVKTLPIGPGFCSADHAPRERTRCPFPQPTVLDPEGDSVLLDTCLGNDFTLLTRNAPYAEAPDFAEDPLIRHLYVADSHEVVSRAGRTVIVDRDGELLAWLNERGCDAVLLRPDRQPFGEYPAPDARPESISRDLRSALFSGARTPAATGVGS